MDGSRGATNATGGYVETILDLTTDDEKIGWAKKQYADINMGRVGKLKQSLSARSYYMGSHTGYADFLMSAPNPTFVNKYTRRVPYAETLIENKRTVVMQSHPRPSISRKMNAKYIEHADLISVVTQNIFDDIWKSEDMDWKLNMLVLDALIDGVSYLQLSTDERGIHISPKKFEEIMVPVDIWDISKAPSVGIKFRDVIGNYKNHPDYKNTDTLRPTHLSQEWDFIDMYAHETDMRTPTVSSEVMDLNVFDGVEWQTLFTLTPESIDKLKGKYPWVAKKKPNDKVLWIMTASGDVVIRDQFLDIDSYHIYPFVPLGGDFSTPSVFSRLVSMGKGYDVLWTTVEEYMAFALKYRILVPRDTITTQITNQNGNIIRYTGDPPSEMEHSDISPGYFDMAEKYEQVMMFLSNINSSTMGDMPTGDKKYKALEAQKLQDIVNAKPMIENLKMCIKRMCEGILDLVDAGYDLRDMVYSDKDGVHQVKIAGAKYALSNPTSVSLYNHTDKKKERFTSSGKDTGTPEPELVIIHKDYPVEINITQGLDYSEQSVQNDLLELARGLPPDSPYQKAFIKAWVLSKDVGEVQRFIDEAEREEAQNNQANTTGSPLLAGANPEPSAPAAGGGPPIPNVTGSNIGGAGVPTNVKAKNSNPFASITPAQQAGTTGGRNTIVPPTSQIPT